jgi:hypothetical protein
VRMAAELATLAPAIAQLEAGDSAGALKMLLRRAECIAGPNARLTAPDTAQRTHDE